MQRLNSISWRRSSQPDNTTKSENNKNKENNKTPTPKSHDPVLSPEDEAFLQQMMARSENGEPVSTVEKGAVSPGSPGAKENDAVNVPLPTSPVEDFGKELGEEGRRDIEKSEKEKGGKREKSPEKPGSSGGLSRTSTVGKEKKRRPWSMLWRKGSEKNKETKTQDVKTSPDKPNDEALQDVEDMTRVLENLNLAAENNRVFSVSVEMQELLNKFKLVFKDLVNGVPTAYHDLEMLLTNGNKQLQETYTKLPGPLQKLIEKLPERWTESLAPEILAAASAKASQSGVNMDNVGKATAAASKMGLKVPSLKELVAKPAALVGMMRSIMAFLRARFPAVLGVNILWSLALSILLFVLWYCHKRGKEVRLENERLVTEEEISKLNEQTSEERIRPTETLTTTAPQGASTDQIRDGVREAQVAREKAIADEENQQKQKERENKPEEETPAPPKRSKSRLSMWSRTPTPLEPTTKIEPYPGT